MMKTKPNFVRVMMSLVLAAVLNSAPSALSAFEGRINAAITQGSQTDGLRYTVGTNFLRVEMTAPNGPNPVDILDRSSGALTLLFPHNRSFVRIKPAAENPSMPSGFPQMPGAPAMPNLPTRQGIGPTNLPGMPAPPPMPAMPNLPPGVGPQSAPGAPTMPAMPMMPLPMLPPPMMEKMELRDMGEKTNLLGFACEQYEIKRRGETMEIWATDQLFTFQPYVRNPSRRFGPRMIQDQWSELVKARELFPLLATLKMDNGAERFRFEVQSVTPQQLTDEDAELFQPPAGWSEIQPRPF